MSRVTANCAKTENSLYERCSGNYHGFRLQCPGTNEVSGIRCNCLQECSQGRGNRIGGRVTYIPYRSTLGDLR